VLVYIGKLGLNYVKEENGFLVIGAATTTARLAEDGLVATRAPALAAAARQSGSRAIRTVATVGGNLANASPAADLAIPLLAMDAEVRLVSAGGERTVPLREFFAGPGETVLRPGELMLEIRVPSCAGQCVFLKLGRRKAMTLSVLNVAVRLEMQDGICQQAHIALGAMAPTPLCCLEAEAMLAGKALDRALIEQCAAAAVAQSSPIDDQRATAWYRAQAGKALVARALARAAGLEG
jgi:CO/xanthine dehydrogenase FAD-binding subunit